MSAAPEKIRYRLTIAYRGTHFHGWQEQTATQTWANVAERGKPLRTVQRTLRLALQHVVQHPVLLVGASRTDSGVHAKGQICHFDTTALQIPLEGLRRAANSRLPEDLTILAISATWPRFDAIYDAIHKRYQYAVWNDYERNVFAADMTFHRWDPLDSDAMHQAAKYLVGTKDFTSFCRPGHGRLTTVRTVTGCSVARRGKLIVIGVSGSGFLWNQVRIMAGTLVEVGFGKFKPEEIPAMLAARDRRVSGSTAPPEGLFLQWIEHRSGPDAPRPEYPDEDDAS